jgi:spermidine synthase
VKLLDIPFYKRIFSYFYPVTVRIAAGSHNPVLELLLYQNRWQLATGNALYSDGHRYRPLVEAFKYIQDYLPETNSVLVLGTGLASAVHILHHMGYHPMCTLVEIDQQILLWALEVLPEEATNVRPICADAKDFIQDTKEKYDVIIIDIFLDRVVPDFVKETEFIKKCREQLNPGGKLIWNYIVNNTEEWEHIQYQLPTLFQQVKIIPFNINRVIVATVA